MKQSEMYSAIFTLLEQNHQELQLDALRELYRSRLLEFNKLKTIEKEKEKIIRTLRSDFDEKSQTINALQQHLNRMSQLLESAEKRVLYDRDYSQRQQYYIQVSQNVDSKNKILGSLKKDWRNYKGVVISPDGLRFQNERIQVLLGELSSAGFLCFSFNEKVKTDVEHISAGFYEYKDEALLLTWLTNQNVSPYILCTWVLQSAWFDLLDSKTIWYDICEHEDVLWGLDASSRLKHYNLLKQATFVTYSDKKWKRYVTSRKDALLLDSDQADGIVIRFKEHGGAKRNDK